MSGKPTAPDVIAGVPSAASSLMIAVDSDEAVTDTDGDGAPDHLDSDDDNDGLSNRFREGQRIEPAGRHGLSALGAPGGGGFQLAHQPVGVLAGLQIDDICNDGEVLYKPGFAALQKPVLRVVPDPVILKAIGPVVGMFVTLIEVWIDATPGSWN